MNTEIKKEDFSKITLRIYITDINRILAVYKNAQILGAGFCDIEKKEYKILTINKNDYV